MAGCVSPFCPLVDGRLERRAVQLTRLRPRLQRILAGLVRSRRQRQRFTARPAVCTLSATCRAVRHPIPTATIARA